MRVNSSFTGFFNSRLVVGFSIVLVMLAIFFIASSFTKHSDLDLRSKQVNLIIRDFGHRLLLQTGDSTSRVMPVVEIKEGTFLLKFEHEFAFNHDSLMQLSRELLSEAQFPAGYTLTVHDCLKASIIYGFQINNGTPDILACKGRSQPAGCYIIEIAFPDLYATTFSSGNLVYVGALLLFSLTLLIGRFGKFLKPSAKNQNHTIIKESVLELGALGKFLFDVKGQRLLLGREVINLTDKECKILELLNNDFGELIPRETLMQKIWINEGVITGRSLDMFVSKLRKKLSGDPALRITNVHGKGYKLSGL